MAFLTLDGTTHDVSKGGSHKEVVGGKTSNEANGGPLREHKYHKRQWTFTTPVRSQFSSHAIIGQVTGLGQQFHFDTGVNSTKGLAPEAGNVTTIIPGEDLQSPPKKIYKESSGELEAYFGAGALEMGPATENLLPAATRDAESTSGFSPRLGGVLANETTIRIQGTQSVKCTTTGASGDGMYFGAATVTAGNTYTASAYIYTTSAVTLRTYINAPGVGLFTGSATPFTTVAGGWVRMETTGVAPVGATTGVVEVYDNTASVLTWYVDMCQLEEQPQATPWVDGTRAAHDLKYLNVAPLSDAITFCCWTRAQSTNPSNDNVLFWIGEATGDEALQLYRRASTNELAVRLIHEEAGVIYQCDSGTWDDQWHHVAVELNPDGSNFRAYVDGAVVLTQSVSSTYFPDLKTYGTSMYIGGIASDTTYWRGPICEAFCVPYMMVTSQIAALAARTTQTPGLPKLDLGGNCNPYAVTGQNFPVVGVADSGSYGNAGNPTDYSRASVSFTLTSCEDF